MTSPPPPPPPLNGRLSGQQSMKFPPPPPPHHNTNQESSGFANAPMPSGLHHSAVENHREHHFHTPPNAMHGLPQVPQGRNTTVSMAPPPPPPPPYGIGNIPNTSLRTTPQSISQPLSGQGRMPPPPPPPHNHAMINNSGNQHMTTAYLPSDTMQHQHQQLQNASFAPRPPPPNFVGPQHVPPHMPGSSTPNPQLYGGAPPNQPLTCTMPPPRLPNAGPSPPIPPIQAHQMAMGDYSQPGGPRYPQPSSQQMMGNGSQQGSHYPLQHPQTQAEGDYSQPGGPRYSQPSSQQMMGNGSQRGSHYPLPHPQTEKPKIDPAQIPRPPLFTRPQQTENLLPVYYPKQAAESNPVQPPPPADSRYTVVDDGNASPDFIRSSTYAFPMDRGVWHKTGDLPLGVLCTPLQIPSQDFVPTPRVNPDGSVTDYSFRDAVPVIPDTGTDGPARCRKCHAYNNPYTSSDGQCNLCRRSNSSPNFVGLARQFGTVEYEVSGPYVTRSNGVVQTQTVLYAIDLTAPMAPDYVPLLRNVVMDLYRHWQRQRHFHMTHQKPSPRVGLCAFGAMGIVMQSRPNGSIVIMPDIQEQPFCPMPLSNWTYDLSLDEDADAFFNWMEHDLPSLLSDWRERNSHYRCSGGMDGLELSCGGAALQFLQHSLEGSGGRGTVLSWRRPNHGTGSLPYRSQQGRNQSEDPTSYLPLQLLISCKSNDEQHAVNFYKQLEMSCVQSRVSLDFVMHTSSRESQQLDLSTIGELCKITSGQLHWINGAGWQETMQTELSKPLQSFVGWDAVFKVRVSEGVEVKSFYTSNGLQVEASVLSGGSAELELSSVLPSTCIAVEFEHRVGGLPKDRGLFFVQTALLFTTAAGRRRVRVSTIAIRTTSVVNEVYRAVDFSALTTLLTRTATDCVLLRSSSSTFHNDKEVVDRRVKARDLIYNKCVEILSNYRLNTPAKNSPMGQLILPEKMQLLPLFCMCLLKSPMLRPALARRLSSSQSAILSPTSEERAYYNYHLSQASPCFVMLLVHPNVFSVTDIIRGNYPDERIGQWQSPDNGESINGFVCIPPMILPSMESLQDDGVYLIDDGTRIFLYLGKYVPDEIKNDLLHPGSDETSVSPTLQLVNSHLHQFRQYSSTSRGSESELRCTSAPVIRVLQHQDGQHQSTAEVDVLNLMVADATAGEKDYVDFLCTLHRRIRERVEGSSKS